MCLAITCNEMYEDLALHIKEELIKVFTADDWGEYTPSDWRTETNEKTRSYTPQALVDEDGLGCFDQFKFIISEEDMKLRGFGDLLGFKQSGLKNFKLADPVHNEDLFILGEQEIKRIENDEKNMHKFKPLLK